MSLIRSEPAGIRIENLGLSFGSTQVLKGVNLEIQPGEFFAFLGPSGSGKSTLLRAIAGFGPEPSGRILIGDKDIARLPPWQRNVGMVFQNYALWPHMSIRRNVAFGLEERKLAKDDIRQRVDDALDLVGLKHLAERRPSQLSGGQQQRIALARTLVVEPRVLLLDEPLSNLDANLRVQMRGELLALQRELGLTTIFVTHDQEEANTTSDRIAVLDQGVIQQVGSPVGLYDEPVNRFVASFLGTANILDGSIRRQDGQARFVSDNGLVIYLDSTDEGSASLVFRPQNASIAHAGSALGARDKLPGTVEEQEFLGSSVRYKVNIQGHQLLIDATHRRGRPDFTPGAEVEVSIDSDSAVLIRSSAKQMHGPGKHQKQERGGHQNAPGALPGTRPMP